ncbi:ribonuclease P protein subunit p21-like, partial [Diorhabda sublineata]|uniref:ribonuclease P protein subunit p21-like n=1 Tax=Diorhabda sublineata TaxID=1163346 RepID=UPI0024E155D3
TTTMNTNKIQKCVGKDGFQRMNYLYQICNIMIAENEAQHSAANFYSNLLIGVSRKTVQRMEIDMKRTICKSCRCLMITGITCRVRIKKKKLIYTCLKCHTNKVFLTLKNDYQCWTQTNQSLTNIFDYSMEKNREVDNTKN